MDSHIPSFQAARMITASSAESKISKRVLKDTGYLETSGVVLIYPIGSRNDAARAMSKLGHLPVAFEVLPYRHPSETAQDIKPEGDQSPVLVVRFTNNPRSELPGTINDPAEAFRAVLTVMGKDYLRSEMNPKRPMGIVELQEKLDNIPDFVRQQLAKKPAVTVSPTNVTRPAIVKSITGVGIGLAR